jgi:hypothetical protein
VGLGHRSLRREERQPEGSTVSQERRTKDNQTRSIGPVLPSICAEFVPKTYFFTYSEWRSIDPTTYIINFS